MYNKKKYKIKNIIKGNPKHKQQQELHETTYSERYIKYNKQNAHIHTE